MLTLEPLCFNQAKYKTMKKVFTLILLTAIAVTILPAQRNNRLTGPRAKNKTYFEKRRVRSDIGVLRRATSKRRALAPLKGSRRHPPSLGKIRIKSRPALDRQRLRLKGPRAVRRLSKKRK